MNRLLLVVALAGIGTLADSLLKRGSTWGLVAGCTLYAATGVGWSWALQHVRLAQLGVYYAISTILLLTLLGFAFGERPTLRDGAGLALGLCSILVLERFA